MDLFLIRHGRTALNASRVVQPPTTPLDALGVAQAEALAERLAALGVSQVVSSDYLRARMTAEVVARRVGVAITQLEGLRERNFGAWRGKPYGEIDLRSFAEPFAEQQADEVVPPQGESWGAFHRRVAQAWSTVLDIAARGGGNLAVVTHGFVVASMVHFHARAAAEPPRWHNASLTVVDAASPHWASLVNCVAHLGALPAEP